MRDEPDREPAPPSPSRTEAAGSRLARLVLFALLGIAALWLVAIAYTLAGRSDAAAPSGDTPGNTRPALHAERVALGPLRPSPRA